MSDAELPEDFQTAPIGEVDPEIAQVLDRELARQQGTLEMIASENFVPQAVLDAAGSVLTNKYAEGYPGKRYYGGCEEVDVAEEIAIARAKELFGAEHANVQPHAGAQANNAVYTALLQPGDTFLGLALDHGGHLTHGMKLNLSGKLYEPVPYHVDRESLRVDMDEVASLAEEHRPKMIVAGWSAYPRQLDFARFREIADSVGALLMVDMAHFAGLVAAGEHPNPVEHADVVTTTVHKTLCGPRSGMILCREEHAKKINSAIFPGNQGGPLMHAIAAKAVALRIAATEEFRERQRRTLDNAKAFAAGLEAGGVKVLTGGTDVHLVLVDVTVKGLDGSTAEDRLEEIGITVNRNAIPFDERPPMNPSGLRIGTPALTTRGLGTDEMREIADVICTALSEDFEAERASLEERTKALTDAFPLYPQIRPFAGAGAPL
ncbi:MAG: serine hydroxymethyltransferase [Solirubrobacterales bacterium]|nr:serine hydroxymethyltransferase [Solirubrobacterales bacterium]MCB8969468.1 serine hydroxymethyltransferase [Thermoleophilales bacterium]